MTEAEAVQAWKDSAIENLETAELDEISTFNVAARYDIFKQRLYRKATEEFTKKWMEIGRKLFNKYLEACK